MAKLNNRQLSDMLHRAFSDAAPDKADDIVAAAKNNSAPTYIVSQENFKLKYLRRAVLAAAVAVVVSCVIIALIAFRKNTPYATITVESDEYVEITLNRDLRPLSISGKNSAAIRLARQAGKCGSIGDAVDGVLDAMLDNGNLGEKSNTVMITVDAPDNEASLLKDSFDAAKASFDDNDFSGAILTAVASDDKNIARFASRHRISVGKAEMVTDIIRADRSFSTENLCRLSVNDLNLLSSYRRILYTNIGVYGESRGLITPQNALAFAAEDLGFSDSSATVTLGVDRYGLIYSVAMHSDSGIYIYRMNAFSGEILAISKGDTPMTAQMADQSTPSPPPTEQKNAPSDKPSENADTPQSYQITVTDPRTDPAPPSPAATERSDDSGNQSAATGSKKQNPTAARQDPAPAPPKPAQTQKPTEAPRPLATEPPAPTEAPRHEPPIFSSGSYLSSSNTLQSGSPLTSSARQIDIRRVINGYDVFYDKDSFPYTSDGQQGGISALVCSTEQLRRLIGTDVSGCDDAYFADHVLYIHMNRDASYHWIKSIRLAYMDGGTLCLENSEPVGYYISTDSSHPERIYTVVYELEKSDLTDLENIIEYTG